MVVNQMCTIYEGWSEGGIPMVLLSNVKMLILLVDLFDNNIIIGYFNFLKLECGLDAWNYLF